MACLALWLVAGAAAQAHPHAAKARFVTRVPTAEALYDRSLKADDHFSYRGRQVTTYWRTGHTVATLVSHRAPDLDRLDYLAPERLQGRNFLSDGRQEWRFYPRERLLRHRRLSADADAVADAVAAYSLLKANYLVVVAPQKQTWEGRKVFLLTITRRKNRRTTRRLWVDAATGLVLKREGYGEGGALAVIVAFTSVNFRAALTRGEFDPARLKRRPGVRVVEEARDMEVPLPVASVPHRLGPGWPTPPTLGGYRLVSAAVTGGRRPRLHLRYSDGLNPVSLFEQRRVQTRLSTRVPHSRPLPVGLLPGRVVRRDAVTAINWDMADFNLTLVGEIGQQTLQQLAASVAGRRP